MAIETIEESCASSLDTESARLQEQTAAINEQLLISSLRQHQLTEDAEKLNEQLRREVAERKRAEEAKSLLSSIVESSDDSIISITPDAVLTSWNHAAEILYGYQAEEVLGKSLKLLALPEDLQQVLARLEKIKQSKAVELFRSARRQKDGSVMWLSVQLSPIKDDHGEIVGVSTIARDITEMKKWEDALRESEERFRALVTTSSEVVYWMSPDWGVMSQLDGRSFLAHTQKLSCNWFEEYIPEEDQPQVMAAVQEAVRGRKNFELEHRVRREDGSVGWVFSRAVPILNEEGEIAEWFGAASDVTERKQAEEKLVELSHALEHRVAELQEQALQLRSLAAELGSTEQRERKRLAALLHDDLQQLLVAARMQLNNAVPQLKDEAARRAVELASRWIEEATNAARDLTRQLRPPALYEDGLVAALHGLASEMVERHHLKVKIQGHAAVKPVSDDLKALLFDSIRELLFNAAKHAEVDEAVVQIHEEAHSLHVMVEDHGKGFNVETAAGRRSSKGFGLFSIRERVAAYGGEVSIASAPERGTRVTLEVPLCDAPEVLGGEELVPEKEMECPRVAKDNGRCARILIVDDHAIVRQGLSVMLAGDERMKIIAEASDGREAISVVEEQQPDVVLLDVNMPGMNGIEAAREIHRRWPETAIIGLSVQDDDATAKSMLDAGASAFMSKSGDSPRMISTIMDLMNKQSVAAIS